MNTLGRCQPIIPKEEQPEFQEKYLRKSEKFAACTKDFIETLLAIRAQSVPEAELVWNAACHVNLVSHDLNALFHVIATTEDIWTSRAIARTLVVIMYEACEDLLELFGKRFIDTCKRLRTWEILEPDYRATRKELARFWKQYGRELKKLRVFAGAHKDHDSLAVLLAIAQLSITDSLSRANELDDILRTFGAFSMKAIEATNKIFRQRGVII